MSKKLLLILAMALSAALIAAGCGDDDSTTSTTSSTTETTETTTDDTGAATGATGADAASIEEACAQAVESQGVPISDDVKAEIENICQEAAASGDPAEIQASTQKVCELVVEDNLPEGAARDQALQACEAAGQ